MVKGMIDCRNESWDEALEHLQEAKRIFEELGAKHSIGRAHAELGLLYRQRNQGGDRRLAMEHVIAAREIFSALGAKSDLEKLPVA
jgi:hypothetical protein